MRYCDKASVTSEALTYAATVSDHAVEYEITDVMISRACEEMDAAQQWPFAAAVDYIERPVPVQARH